MADGARSVPPTADGSAPDVPIDPLVADLRVNARSLPAASSAMSTTTRPTPTRLAIADLDVDAPVAPVGVTATGELDVPDPLVVGWYRFGAGPGAEGATVLAAHVDFNRVPGVFRYLTRLEPGAEIAVTTDDGTVHRYVVTERTMYDKESLPPERVWARSGEPTLVLLTCGGRFDRSRRSFDQNVVVYAAPR